MDPWVGKIPLTREWWPIPVFCITVTHHGAPLKLMNILVYKVYVSKLIKEKITEEGKNTIWFKKRLIQLMEIKSWNLLNLNNESYISLKGFPGGSVSKESACNAGDPSSISGLGISPGEGKGYPLHYSGLENSMDRGAWRATMQRVTDSDMSEQLSTHSQREARGET